MKRLIVRSFFEDIKNFKNMIPYRTKKIEETDAVPLPETYNANKLSTALHPDNQRVSLSSAVAIDNKTKIITLSSCSSVPLAPFRAGQGINIKHGTKTTFFPILSAPEEENYSVIASSDSSDEVTEFLFNADKNTEIDVSGPVGLFYYSHLRDGDSIVLICDNSGAAPVISICKHLIGNANKTVTVLFLDEEENYRTQDLFKTLPADISVSYVKSYEEIYKRISTQICSPAAFFASGKQDFCNKIKSLFNNHEFLRGSIKTFISEPSLKVDVPPEEYRCQVFYRDKSFNFSCLSNETLLSAFERNNVPTQAKCKVGECGYCRCKLLEGKIETVLCGDIDSLLSADEKYNFIHPCRAFPKTDIKVKL